MGGDFGVVDHLDAVRGVCWRRFVAWGGLVLEVELWLPTTAETAMVVVFFLFCGWWRLILDSTRHGVFVCPK